jgi:hypothetical protein
LIRRDLRSIRSEMMKLSEMVRRVGKEKRTGKKSEDEVAFDGVDESHSEVEEREESEGANHNGPTTVHLQREGGDSKRKGHARVNATDGREKLLTSPSGAVTSELMARAIR